MAQVAGGYVKPGRVSASRSGASSLKRREPPPDSSYFLGVPQIFNDIERCGGLNKTEGSPKGALRVDEIVAASPEWAAPSGSPSGGPRVLAKGVGQPPATSAVQVRRLVGHDQLRPTERPEC